MQDSRLDVAKSELEAAMLELDQPEPDEARVLALLDDARTNVVDVVEGGISAGCSKSDLNQLDCVRQFINRAASLLDAKSPRAWVYSSVQQFIGHGLDHLAVVMSSNVVPIRGRRPGPGGGAA
ncbi:hypothetical protein [Mycolicibacterium austroafricanum]|uniref:hypothetical protein n=1 Tax=Mycolicibacterium austroafricanum TaxID=39687 RepID=UPI001ABFDE54|nr:hypothetical protein [Mycolicibacterium austroafricanum]QRZ05923.1 hypothetical protein JN090_23845 [Mycolicibacterium austroafricanum]